MDGDVIRDERLVAENLDLCPTRLANVDERLQKVVEYRFFGGMTEPEIAAVLDVSTRTVQRDWAKARAWLYRELYETEGRAKTGASDE